jgi:hypothetical protein
VATGYEVKMYNDISRIAKALERIAKAIEERTADEVRASTLVDRAGAVAHSK